jgi:hypothetical protein
LDTNTTVDASIYGQVEQINADGHEAICKLTWARNEAADVMRSLVGKLAEEFSLLGH